MCSTPFCVSVYFYFFLQVDVANEFKAKLAESNHHYTVGNSADLLCELVLSMCVCVCMYVCICVGRWVDR